MHVARFFPDWYRMWSGKQWANFSQKVANVPFVTANVPEASPAKINCGHSRHRASSHACMGSIGHRTDIVRMRGVKTRTLICTVSNLTSKVTPCFLMAIMRLRLTWALLLLADASDWSRSSLPGAPVVNS